MEQNEIDNAREWMKAKYPAEWQTDRIPANLTFTWMAANIGSPDLWDPQLELDTAPRETILAETARRIIRSLRGAGFVRRAIEDIVAETPDWAGRMLPGAGNRPQDYKKRN